MLEPMKPAPPVTMTLTDLSSPKKRSPVVRLAR